MEFNVEKYGWKHYDPHKIFIDKRISMKIRRFYIMLNVMGLPQYLEDKKIYFHDNTFELLKRCDNLIYLINNSGTYIIHSNKIFMIEGDFTYIDIDVDFLKIKLVSENLDDIIKLKLFSDKLLREDKLNDLLNSQF